MHYMAAGQDNSTSIKLYSQDPGSGQPAAHPAGLPIECSTASAPMSSPLTHSSSGISPRRSPEQKSLTPRSHQDFGIRSGSQGMMAGSKGVLPGTKVVAKTDFTKNIEKLNVVMPILHGDGQERNRAQDAGVVDANDKDSFIAAAKTRQWDREKSVRKLA